MDPDALVEAHAPAWRRLDELCRRRRLDGAEADELLDLYRRAGTHLSQLRATAADPEAVAYLSWLLARARARVSRSRGAGPGAALTFVSETFPAALYRLWPWWSATALGSVALAAVLLAWFLAHPGFEGATTDPEAVRRLVESDFENYYSEHAATSFAFHVWTNNAWIAALCVAFGVLGVPVLLLLWTNVLNLAFSASLMIGHGRGALFFGLILPHGLLELTAVFVAAGVGLRLFWAWVEPGPRPRSSALAQEGRRSVAVAVGLAGVLFVSGLVEAFVTPSPLPTWARIAVGVAVELAFLAYVFVLGRSAARRGVTGDVTGAAAEAVAPAAG